jgi:hypothetical protein
MARETAHIGANIGKAEVQKQGKETAMTISTVGYPRTEKRLHSTP